MVAKKPQTKLFRTVFKRAEVLHAIYKRSWQKNARQKKVTDTSGHKKSPSGQKVTTKAKPAQTDLGQTAKST
ncbi:unnamed protein product [Rotaria socialis]|nr:unnamed protein product [Rotaria socialis]CAF3411937.1 unnamed protein product [Rotaria socialis]